MGLFVVDPIPARVNRNNLTMIPRYTKFVAAPTVNSQDLLIGSAVTFGLNRSSGLIGYATMRKLLLRHKIFAVNTVRNSVPKLSLKLIVLVEQVASTIMISSGVLLKVLQAKNIF